MPLYANWATNNEYSFSTNTQGITPLTYKYVRLVGIMTYDVARIVEGDSAYAKWRRIFPHLTPGTVDDPAQYDWLFSKAANGESIILAAPWIEGSTVNPVKFRQERIILTDTTDAQIQQVKMFLSAVGATFTSEPI